MDVAAQIADFFDVSVDYLLGHSKLRRVLPANKLTPLENNIMTNVRKLDVNRQKQVDAFVQGMLL